MRLLFLCIFPMIAAAAQPSGQLPDVGKVIRPPAPEFIDPFRITTADSAVFVQPRPREVLSGPSTVIELSPRCAIDSTTIFVRHSYSKVDTLAHLRRPPWRTEWKHADIPDQDQIHLQFGYRIFQPGGKVITSPSLPHQWALSRGTAKSRKKYRCTQVVSPDSMTIDGKPDEWKRIRRAATGGGGSFALCWTSATVMVPATLYLLAEVRDGAVRPTDVVELHLDPYRTREVFASGKQRSILFAPTGRSYCFTADSTGKGGYRQSDSIAALMNDVVKWRSTVRDSGYILEAAIPFYTLSEMKYPPRAFGFDVSFRGGGEPFDFAGWANRREYARYSPAGWGTLVFSRRTLPLVVILLLGAFTVAAIAGALTFATLRNSAVARGISRREASGEPPGLLRLRKYVNSNLGDASLSIDSATLGTALSADEITNILQTELNTTFERFVGFSRVVSAKRQLADAGVPLDAIARRCGFGTVEAMNASFREYLRTDPEEYRRRIREAAAEDDEGPVRP